MYVTKLDTCNYHTIFIPIPNTNDGLFIPRYVSPLSRRCLPCEADEATTLYTHKHLPTYLLPRTMITYSVSLLHFKQDGLSRCDHRYGIVTFMINTT